LTVSESGPAVVLSYSGSAHTSTFGTGDSSAGDDAGRGPTTAAETGTPKPTSPAKETTTATETTPVKEATPVSTSGTDSSTLAPTAKKPKRWSVNATALPSGVADTASAADSAAPSLPQAPPPPRPVVDEAAVQRAAPPPPASTAPTDSPQQAFVAPQVKPATASAPAAPASAGTGVVSNVSAWVGLAPLATDSPTAPVESPALWAVCAWCRRQNEKSLIGDTPTNSSTPTQNSQTIDGLVTGDLNAAGDQGDRQALADPSITALSAPVTVDVASPATTSTTFAQASAATPQTQQSGRSRPGGDTTAPTVSVTAPTNDATVSGTAVALAATAADNLKVVGVQFQLDGAALGAEDTKAPYGVSWNTTTVSNGGHTLTAVARDAAGNNTTSATVSVTVNNPDITPPTVSLTAPATGATVSGTVSVGATATDNVGVAGVQFLLDGAALGAEDPTSAYGVSWNTTQAANGTHLLTAVARDAAGNNTTSATVSVTVNNPDITNPDITAPTVSLIGPATGATVKGTVNVGATAADNVGVAGVQFLLDDAALGAEDPTSPYGPVSWNTATVSDGTHTLTAVARDAAGNTTTSAPVTVTVANASNHPPELQGEPTVGAADLDTGRVSGSFTIIDEDADILSYIITGPFNGDVAVYHQWESATDLTHTFNYTYTPTQAARDQAAQTSGPDTDGFSVEIGDGAARTWVNVTVPIEPRPSGIPIWQGPTTDTFDPVTGASTGNINAIDPDNDPLGYSVVYGPWYGTLDLDTETGDYTYTPTGTGDLNLGELVTIGVSDGQYTIYRDWWLWTFVTFAPL
jgi:hypothetical protein